MQGHASRRRAIIGAGFAAAFVAIIVVATIGGAGRSAAAPAPPNAAVTAEKVRGLVHVCSSCHGPEGRSINSTFPRLAGQQKAYLEAQLKAFRDHKRADPHAKTYMWGMAARLTNAEIAGIAAYYSAQRPVPGVPNNSPQAAAGRTIFDNGIAAEHVPACKSCHGDKGQGLATIPRLAGQHEDYIERELDAFAANRRANDIMHENAKNLTAWQIADIAAYVRTLN